MENHTRRDLLKSAAAMGAAFAGTATFLPEAAAQSGNMSEKKSTEASALVPSTSSAVSPRMYYASRIPQVSLDCDLNSGKKIGGGIATDNTAAFNRILATATATSPVMLVIDGASVISGLELPPLGHASIVGLGWDTGFYVKSGSNADAIHNGGPTAAIPSDPASIGLPLPPASSRGSNVRFADFRINGNRGDGKIGNSNSGYKRGNTLTWFFGINMMNLDHIEIDHLWMYDISSFNVRLSDCGYISIHACKFEAHNFSLNTDGVHVDGGCNDITISDCCFDNIGDDSIALNAPEGYRGDISNVLVTNCFFNHCLTLMRIYCATTDSVNNVRGVAISNCKASVTTVGILLGLGNAGVDVGGNPDGIFDVTVSNCTIAAPIFCQVTNNVGILKFSGCTWLAPNEATTFVFFGAAVSSLVISGCSIYRDSTSKNATPYLFDGAGSVGTITINGFSIDDQPGHTFPAVPYLTTQTGVVSRLIVDALDMANITAFARSIQVFTSISGPGVISTGAEFPDKAVMNGTLYLSATTHLPSIKIGGKVKTFNLG